MTAKLLKEQNRIYVWLIIAINLLFLSAVVQAGAIRTVGMRTLFTDATNLVPAGFAFIAATVFNGVLSADTKARLVFLRWTNTLPGHRAFSKYGRDDPRVDIVSLEKAHGPLPPDPVEQNRLWFQLYKTVEDQPTVLLVHKDFLLTRDYAGLSFLFLVFLVPAVAYLVSDDTTRLVYAAILLAQYLVARQAAHTYGVRLVTTVLSRVAS